MTAFLRFNNIWQSLHCCFCVFFFFSPHVSPPLLLCLFIFLLLNKSFPPPPSLLEIEAGDLGHSQRLRQQHWPWLMLVGWLFTAWLHLPNAGEALGSVNLSFLSVCLHKPGLYVKQSLSRYAWAQCQVLLYSPGSFVCYLSSLLTLLLSHTHHLSLTVLFWLYSTSSHLWSQATLSPVYLHYPQLKIYCSELRPILHGWLRRWLLFRVE